MENFLVLIYYQDFVQGIVKNWDINTMNKIMHQTKYCVLST